MNKRLEKEDLEKYESLKKKKKTFTDVIAIFCDTKNGVMQFVLITIGDRRSIETYLPNCDGKAVSIALKKGKKHFLLLDEENQSFLIFSKNENGPLPFSDIDKEDVDIASYLSNL